MILSKQFSHFGALMEQKKSPAQDAEKTSNKMQDAGQDKKQEEISVQKEFADLKETLQRVQAEFENSRKRLEKEKQDFALVANFHLMKEMLPVLDSIDAAEQGIARHESASRQDALKGIELIKKQLLAILSTHGLREIKCSGQRFDPMLHECVMQGNEKAKQDNCVLEEIQKGYLLNGKVLRHSKVKVNKWSDEK